MLRDLVDAQLIHVGDWRNHSAGANCPPCKVFFHGPGKPALRPIASGAKRRSIKAGYRHRLIKQIGRDLHNRIELARRKGASRLVLDGVTVWQRGVGVFREAAKKLQDAV